VAHVAVGVLAVALPAVSALVSVALICCGGAYLRYWRL